MRSELRRRLSLGALVPAVALLAGCLDYTTQPQTPFGTLRDVRDGRSYRTVAIGTQTWMAENLAYAGSGRCYDGLEANCLTHGRLYSWSQAMGLEPACDSLGGAACGTPADGGRGICPQGWHLPTDAEWTRLIGYVGGDATRLKSEAMDGDNASGLGILPAGIHDTDGVDKYLGVFGDLWTATPKDGAHAWEWYFEAREPVLRKLDAAKRKGLAVRCLKDEP